MEEEGVQIRSKTISFFSLRVPKQCSCNHLCAVGFSQISIFSKCYSSASIGRLACDLIHIFAKNLSSSSFYANVKKRYDIVSHPNIIAVEDLIFPRTFFCDLSCKTVP